MRKGRFAGLSENGAAAADGRVWRAGLRRADADQGGFLPRLAAIAAALVTLHLAAGAALLLQGVPAEAAIVLAGGTAVLLPFPALLAIAGAGTVAILAITLGPLGAALGGAFCACLLGLSLSRAQAALKSGERHRASERRARKAGLFVGDVEESGRGWFWQTNAEGALTYLSGPFAERLGRKAGDLIGRPFSDLLLVEDDGGPEGAKPALGFHLSARFPFAGVAVRPNGRQDLWWSLSGTPRFDAYGRFLGFRGMAWTMEAVTRADAEMSRLAVSDSLTGLPNRASMRSTLEDALRNAESRREGCALLLVDLDRFKQVNDTLGHPIGDVVLREVAQRMTAVIGNDGQAGRLGGDEFEIVLPGIDEEGRLGALADRLIGEISRPYLVKNHRISVGASVGIAISRPGRTLPEGLVKEADLALYAAKGSGRGTYCFFEANLQSQEADRRILTADLRGALEKGQLRLLYHPIVDAITEELAGFEALLRWAHPTRGLLSPPVFLPLAEESGLIGRIGAWVLRTACEEAAKWPRHARLSVNVSPVQLSDPAFPALVAGSLAASGLEPERLEFDLREESFLGEAAAALEKVAGLGVRLAIDDFGDRASSLASLRSAPLSTIKLDPALLRGAAIPGCRSAALIRAIAGMAEGLGIGLVAEGVENQADLAVARELGCPEIQGFVFGRPVEAAEAARLASESRAVEPSAFAHERLPRQSLIRKGMIRADGRNHEVRLRNISAAGAMLECARPLEAGLAAELDLGDGIALPAEIRWAHDGRVGLRFAETFELKRLARRQSTRGNTMLTPEYLTTENSPTSPWAGRQERLTLKDVRRS